MFLFSAQDFLSFFPAHVHTSLPRGRVDDSNTVSLLQLDEWRIWNGIRSRTEIVELMQRPLSPRSEDSYGDPTRIAGTATGVRTIAELAKYYMNSCVFVIIAPVHVCVCVRVRVRVHVLEILPGLQLPR
jgi:hypothetical protein